ncbi:MAG TPA: alpha/beta fold hydrolase [Xanthobacteraceae bacterium]|nr:alpha/beta fold hydrolase [Xanthobacteraceae bacterium]HUO00298.1 alpha/beta fold hydrolase [Bradyrhizobium sp.]
MPDRPKPSGAPVADFLARTIIREGGLGEPRHVVLDTLRRLDARAGEVVDIRNPSQVRKLSGGERGSKRAKMLSDGQAPEGAPVPPRRRLSAILALDVVGYTSLVHKDAPGTLAALNAIYRSIVTPAVAAADGRVVKLLGDGALIEFPSARAALRCAIQVQQEMRRPDPLYSFSEPIRLRAGLHAGDVVVEDGDILGEGIAIASRLQAAAQPGGILASRSFCDLAGSDAAVRLRREGLHSFKGFTHPIEVLAVDFADATVSAQRAALAQEQEIRFCPAKDNVRLAWTVNGNGPTVVKAPNWIGHLELDWRSPFTAPIIASIADKYRLIRFDQRGNGLSDWDVGEISFERFVDDLECIFDAARVERAPIIAISQGGAIAAAFAARCPARVSAIVMIGAFVRGRNKRSSKRELEQAQALRAMMAAGWDDEYPSLRDLLANVIVPTASEEERRLVAEDMRRIISPENVARFREAVDEIDVAALLGDIACPCLVLHCRGDRMQPVEQGRAFAAGLPNARFIAYDSPNHIPVESDPIWPLMERDILTFLSLHASREAIQTLH